MKEIRQITCIRCPMGCQLTVEITDGVVTGVTGNLCQRGEEYAKTECVNPVRTLTTTIRLLNGAILSVRSREPLPKAMLGQCLDAVKAVKLNAPVYSGDVVFQNICNTGIDMIATGEIL